MKILDYVSAIIMPFLENPVFLYVIVLALIGTDAYFFTTTFNGIEPSQIFSLPKVFCLTIDAINSNIFFGGLLTPLFNFTGATSFCVASAIASDVVLLGVFGGLLTMILHLVGVPEAVTISSAQLFFVMLFLPVIVWIATHQLGKT